MLFYVAIDYMHCQQSLLVLVAEQVQCVGFTVDQCLIASIQVREEPGAWRKDRSGPGHRLDTSDDFDRFCSARTRADHLFQSRLSYA
jgi:hypothetical protein